MHMCIYLETVPGIKKSWLGGLSQKEVLYFSYFWLQRIVLKKTKGYEKLISLFYSDLFSFLKENK